MLLGDNSPRSERRTTARVTAASAERKIPANWYTEKTVLYQWGSRDMSQSVLASQKVSAKTTRKTAALLRLENVSSRPPSRSCLREGASNQAVMATQMIT